jgi:hypothetical protein
MTRCSGSARAVQKAGPDLIKSDGMAALHDMTETLEDLVYRAPHSPCRAA